MRDLYLYIGIYICNIYILILIYIYIYIYIEVIIYICILVGSVLHDIYYRFTIVQATWISGLYHFWYMDMNWI